MRYAYHFEFCERPELPEKLRGELFQSLAWVQTSVGLSRVLESAVPELLELCEARRVIELGSGSGDGLVGLARALESRGTWRAGQPLRLVEELVASDLFPHAATWRKKFVSSRTLRWIDAPVGFDDFERTIPMSELRGSVLLLSAAFHHLPPERAHDFLKRAASVGAHVLVVEPLMRTWFGVVLGALAGVLALGYPVLGKGLRFTERLRAAAFHWALPVIPLILAHDGVVSAFRQRNRGDWEQLMSGLGFELSERSNLGVLGNFSAILLKFQHVVSERHHRQ